MKISELKENEVILCKTKEEFNRICSLNKEWEKLPWYYGKYGTKTYINPHKSISGCQGYTLENYTYIDSRLIEKDVDIELIMEELWCWDDSIGKAALNFIIFKRNSVYPFVAKSTAFKNASKENPNGSAKLYSLDEVCKAVNNWSMTKINDYSVKLFMDEK